jgi:hypothetical protein
LRSDTRVVSGRVKLYLASVDDLTVKVMGASSVAAVSSAMVEVSMMIEVGWGDQAMADKGARKHKQLG